MAQTAALPGATSSTATFSDPDSYGQAIRATQAEIVLTERGDFHSALTKIDFQRLWMQRGHDTLPRVAWHRNDPSRAPIYFLSELNQAPISESGTELVPGEIAFPSLGAMHHSRTTAANSWSAMSLRPDDLASVSHALVGHEIAAPSVSHNLRPDPASMSRLMKLHAEAGRLATTAPETLANPQVARALEQQLIHSMVRCLATGEPAETSASHRRHTAILSRLEALLAAVRRQDH